MCSFGLLAFLVFFYVYFMYLLVSMCVWHVLNKLNSTHSVQHWKVRRSLFTFFYILSIASSSSSPSSLAPSTTPALQAQTYLFHKSFPSYILLVSSGHFHGLYDYESVLLLSGFSFQFLLFVYSFLASAVETRLVSCCAHVAFLYVFV